MKQNSNKQRKFISNGREREGEERKKMNRKHLRKGSKKRREEKKVNRKYLRKGSKKKKWKPNKGKNIHCLNLLGYQV